MAHPKKLIKDVWKKSLFFLVIYNVPNFFPLWGSLSFFVSFSSLYNGT